MIVTEQQFGIIFDFFGTKEDIPSIKLKQAYMPESKNVFLHRGRISAMPGAADSFLDGNDAKVQTTDGNPVIRYHRHVSTAGVEYIFVYTKAHVYQWNTSTKAFDLFFTCASDCTLWDTASIDGKIVSTNNVDKVQVWDETTPGTIFADLGLVGNGLDLDGGSTYLTKAAYVTSFENYLILGDTTEGGTHYGNRIRWSTSGDITDYNTGGAGDTGSKDFDTGYGTLKGFGHYNYQGADILVVFKEKAHYPMWLVETSPVFNIGDAEGYVGLLATHSVINDAEGRLYFIGSDYSVRMFRGPVISRNIDVAVKNISVTYQANIESAFIARYNQLWWSIPGSAGSTGNDKVVALNLAEGDYPWLCPWHVYEFSIRAFGVWSEQSSYTIDGLDSISSTIDGLDAVLDSIDSVEALSGYPIDLGSDHSGYTYNLHASETDMGNAITWNFVLSSDLTEKVSLREYKRAYQINCYFGGKGADESITMYAKEDTGENYETLGLISINSTSDFIDGELPVDLRAKHFLFKGEGSGLFDFLGLFVLFEFDGMY